jgi:hypothetical protein
MGAPLAGRRVLVCGSAASLHAAAELAGLLGADVVRTPVVPSGPALEALVGAGPPAQPLVVGALDTTGRLAAAAPPFPVVTLPAEIHPQHRWAASGAAALTGPPAGPPGLAPGGLVPRLEGLGALVQLLAAARGAVIALDPVALLGERAAIAGFGRRGRTGVGASAELWATADGWLALNLARPDDVDLVPALTEGALAPGDVAGLAAVLCTRPSSHWVERAGLLGLAAGAVPGSGAGSDGRGTEPPDAMLTARGQWPVAAPFLLDGAVPRPPAPRPDTAAPTAPVDRDGLVVDLTSLWAGPLAGGLLARAGAHVVKVEGARRPDGARRGPPAFFDALNVGKAAVALDFDDPADRAVLDALLARAAVVLEGSRPRVMDRLGIDPARYAAHGATWISITGYGRVGPWSNRVAFGDDAAAAAGLVHWDDVGDGARSPCFVADAAADPIAGLTAAVVALAALVGDGGQVVDVALREAAAFALRPVAGDDPRAATVVRGDPAASAGGPGAWAVDVDGVTVPVAEPTARRALGEAAPFGAHTASVRTALTGSVASGDVGRAATGDARPVAE